MRSYLRDVLINVVLSSTLVPSRARWRLLRLFGFDLSPCAIWPGARITGTKLTIGRGCFINHDVYIHCVDRVTLEDGSGLGPGAMVLTGDHELGPTEHRYGEPTFAPVTIGSGTWVGARVCILPGVTIGEGCIVAAGALVSSDLEANCVYGGVPAKLLRRLEPSDQPRLPA